jgi:cytochrome c biogenesis protein CcmG/thiol:disulfide interchange protein DsbE
MDKNELPNWVDERLAKLNPESAWRPDSEQALLHFKQRSERRNGFGRMWIWGAVVAATACACLLAFPTSRDIVQRLWMGSSVPGLVDMGQVSADLKTLKYGQPPPEFDLKDASGVLVRLSDYKGSVVLINFWATWCGGCKIEIPWLMEFENKYRGKGLTVIGVSMDEQGWQMIEPFVKEKQLNYTMVLGTGEMAKRYGLGPMPMTILIDREGNVSAASVGIVNKNECETEIVSLLGK